MPNQVGRRLTRRLVLHLLTAVLAVVSVARTVRADEITVWNFNDSDLIVDHGNGSLTCNFNASNISFAAGTTNNIRLGDLAGQALSLQGGTSNANNGRNITFNISTLGFQNIVVSLATQGTSTGFNSNQFQYSIDGVNFIDFGAPYAPATSFGSVPVVFSLAAIADLNNNPNAAFRIVFNGATSSTGNNRLDNLVVEGSTLTTTTTIPEPGSIVLLTSGLGTLLGVGRARKRAVSKINTDCS